MGKRFLVIGILCILFIGVIVILFINSGFAVFDKCNFFDASTEKDDCYSKLAFSGKIGSQKYCEKISAVLERDNCFTNLAIKNTNDAFFSKSLYKIQPELCASITGQERRNNCYNALSLQRNDASLCIRIVPEVIWVGEPKHYACTSLS